jgi:hypothetical protein
LQAYCSFSFKIRMGGSDEGTNQNAGRYCFSLRRHRYTSVGKTSWSSPQSLALSGTKYVAVCAIPRSPRARSNRPVEAGRSGPIVHPTREMITPGSACPSRPEGVFARVVERTRIHANKRNVVAVVSAQPMRWRAVPSPRAWVFTLRMKMQPGAGQVDDHLTGVRQIALGPAD